MQTKPCARSTCISTSASRLYDLNIPSRLSSSLSHSSHPPPRPRHPQAPHAAARAQVHLVPVRIFLSCASSSTLTSIIRCIIKFCSTLSNTDIRLHSICPVALIRAPHHLHPADAQPARRTDLLLARRAALPRILRALPLRLRAQARRAHGGRVRADLARIHHQHRETRDRDNGAGVSWRRGEGGAGGGEPAAEPGAEYGAEQWVGECGGSEGELWAGAGATKGEDAEGSDTASFESANEGHECKCGEREGGYASKHSR